MCRCVLAIVVSVCRQRNWFVLGRLSGDFLISFVSLTDVIVLLLVMMWCVCCSILHVV